MLRYRQSSLMERVNLVSMLFCKQASLKYVAFQTPSPQLAFIIGDPNRRGPTGGSAKGTPLKTLMVLVTPMNSSSWNIFVLPKRAPCSTMTRGSSEATKPTNNPRKTAADTGKDSPNMVGKFCGTSNQKYNPHVSKARRRLVTLPTCGHTIRPTGLDQLRNACWQGKYKYKEKTAERNEILR